MNRRNLFTAIHWIFPLSLSLMYGAVPDPPRDWMASPGNGIVTLQWSGSSDAVSYTVERSTSVNGTFAAIASELADLEFVDEAANNRRDYFYRVAAVNADGSSEWTSILSARPTTGFLDILPAGAELEELASGLVSTEGPLWIPQEGGYLLFSDIPANRLYRWSFEEGLSVFRDSTQANTPNGNAMDGLGRLLTCEALTHRVSITQLDGTIETLVDRIEGRRFNAPNDVTVKSDGTVWFTDPTYNSTGSLDATLGRNVYRYDPSTESVTLMASGFSQPNGLVFSPDQSRLYVGDSGGPWRIYYYDLNSDGTLSTLSLVSRSLTGAPDGMEFGPDDRLYATANDNRIHVFDLEHTLLGKLEVPREPRNVAFGGPDGRMMFITAITSIYGITYRPDLVLTGVSHGPENPSDQDAIEWIVTIKNQGTGPSPLGESLKLSVQVGENVFQSHAALLGELLPGASLSVSLDQTQRIPAGSYEVQVRVNDDNEIVESLIQNNTWEGTLSVQATESEPPPATGNYFVYVAAGRSNRILPFRQDPVTGELTPMDPVALSGGPGPLAVDPNQRFLYAGLSSNQVTAFEINSETGELTALSTTSVLGNPVYLSVDATGRWLMMADFSLSLAGVYPILDGGRVGGRQIQQVRTGTNAHAILADSSNRFVFIPAMNASRVEQYLFDETTGRLESNDPAFIQKANGTGPRHFVFHPFLNVVYFINELASSVTAYTLDSGTGLLAEFQELSSVSEDYVGRRWSADIEITPDGRFLYASNRAIDTIAGYGVEGESGRLSLIGFTDTEQTPRDFAIDPTGRFLYAGGQDSNKLAAFAIDQETGALERIATYDADTGPQWVLPLFFPESPVLDRPILSIASEGADTVTLSWDGLATLLQASDVDGDFQPVENATSPWNIQPTNSAFFRLRRDETF